MGLLDDAIREHLELKRRHGADPGELAQLEREAFGPARKAPEPLEVPPAAPAAEAAPEPALPDADAEVRPLPTESEALPEPAPEEPPVQETVAFDPADLAEAEGRRAPLEALPPEPEPDSAAPPEPADEDVLEETPEFLQETPEHDRLWFEQRPPRDFDF
jgi:hypothetical protein